MIRDRNTRPSYHARMLEAALAHARKPAPAVKADRAASRAKREAYIDSLPDDHITKLRFLERRSYRAMLHTRNQLRKMCITTDGALEIGAKHAEALDAMEMWKAAKVRLAAKEDQEKREARPELRLVSSTPTYNKPLLTSGDKS